MKVVAINGSPRKDGNCAQMLEVLGKVLEQEGIEFEVCQPGAKVHPVHGVLSLPGQRHAALRAG